MPKKAQVSSTKTSRQAQRIQRPSLYLKKQSRQLLRLSKGFQGSQIEQEQVFRVTPLSYSQSIRDKSISNLILGLKLKRRDLQKVQQAILMKW